MKHAFLENPCLDKSAEKIENGLEYGFVEHWLNSV